ncbi:MAG: hypothetical protein AAFV53_17265 [Myxococcota bacterium]
MHLKFPSEIDAHLSFAALDAVPVTLRAGTLHVNGQLDMADDYARFPFLAQDVIPPAPGVMVQLEYVFEDRLWRFTTIIASVDDHRRWQLRRPRRIEQAARVYLQAA